MRADREAVECFHLHFLRLLAARADRTSFIVKGGCNLRFFFGSIRYSEDLDLDVDSIASHLLKDRVNAILASKTFRETIRSAEISVSRVSTPKQTETTQRWKIELARAGQTLGIHTKIEFSRRDKGGETKVEAIDARVSRKHKLTPQLVCHYALSAAVRQKLRALVGRTVVKARDIFDLNLLFAKTGDLKGAFADVRPVVENAKERVLSVEFDDYKSQVVAYLEPDDAEPYVSEEVWDAMRLHVVDALEAIAR